MSRNRKKQTKTKKKTWAFYAILISLIIFAIPLVYLGYTGIVSLMNRGEPIIGTRFNNDLDPVISDDDLKLLETTVVDFEKVAINLNTATLRIYITDSNLTESNLESTLKGVYDQVISVLDVESYFTARGVQKQYDLEIYGDNGLSDDAFVYGLVSKGSNAEVVTYQLLSKPLSSEMVDYFEQNDIMSEVEGSEETAPEGESGDA